jgi:hypothetical protein
MRLKKGGMLRALVLSTVGVFVGTWLLHSYQWFWLLGAFPLTVTDAAFWGVFGGFVVVNSAWQFRKGKKATLTEPPFTVRGAAVHALKVVAMFSFIAVLWSFWYSPSPADWAAIMAKAANGGLQALPLIALAVAVLVAIGVGLQYLQSRGVALTLSGSRPAVGRAAAFTSLGALLLLAAGTRPVQELLGPRPGRFLASLQQDRLTEYDAQQADRGYYDALMTSNSLNRQVGGLVEQPAGWVPLENSDAVRQTGDARLYELFPDSTIEHKRVPLITNRWGMHDREYALAKPAGTFRIAFMGASIEMGPGVVRDHTYEAVAEERLNAALAGRGGYDRYEILNFAVGGYSVLQQLLILDRVLGFDPDLVVLAGHTATEPRTMQVLIGIIRDGHALPPHVEALRREAGVDASSTEIEIVRGMRPYAQRIMTESYAQLAARVQAAGARPVWVSIPRTQEKERQLETISMNALVQMAREAGFTPLSITDAYQGVEDRSTIALAAWDDHPNVLGHQLLGARLAEVLVEHAEALGLTAPAETTAAR